jgi:LuxR family maltose regulon positive regulatory protein
MALAKTTPPVVHGIVPRPRLFRQLDRGRSCPLTWVSGPPGSGKTSLVASYIETRRLFCLWYQVDSGDKDLASSSTSSRRLSCSCSTNFRKRKSLSLSAR